MKHLLTILLSICGLFTQAQIRGYITVNTAGSYQACAATNITTPVYAATAPASWANGTILYSDAALTIPLNGGWGWAGFTEISGSSATTSFSLQPGGTIFNFTSIGNCGGGSGGGGGSVSCTDPISSPVSPKVKLYMENFIDWSGYQGGELSGHGPRVENIIDDNCTSEFIPGVRSGATYDANFGYVAEFMLGDTARIDHIAFYDKRGYVSDSVYVFLVRAYGVYDTLVRYLSNGTAGWKIFNAGTDFPSNKGGRSIAISFRRNTDPYFVTSIAEFKVYAQPLSAPSFPVPSSYAGPYRYKTFGEKLGYNDVFQISASKYQPMTHMRRYKYMSWVDEENAPYNQATTKFQWNKSGNDFAFQQASLAAGIAPWSSFRGRNEYIATTLGGRRDEGPSTNLLTDNRKLPASYKRYGDMGYHWAAIRGRNSTIPLGSLRIIAPLPTGTGLGVDTIVENGNEVEGWWKGSEFINITEYATQSVVFYDGWNSTLGSTIGVKNADPSMKVFAAGQIAPDTNWVKSLIRISRRMHPLSKVPFDGFSFHYYPNSHVHVETIPQDGYDNTTGQAPEHPNQGMRKKLYGYANVVLRENPNFLVGLTEFNIDRSQVGFRANHSHSVIGHTPFSVPIFGGLDSAGAQAKFTERMIVLGTASPIDYLTLYWGIDGPESFLTFGTMGLLKADQTTEYPLLKVIRQDLQRFGNYKFDSVITEIASGLQVFKFKHKSIPDSIMYAVWHGTTNNTTANTTIILPGAMNGGTMEKFTPGVNGTPAVSTIPAVGSISVTANEQIDYYLGRLTTSSANILPVANATTAGILATPSNSASISGAGSTDADGTITNYSWTQIFGTSSIITSPNSVNTTVTGLTEGVYRYELTVVDNLGGVSKSIVQVIVWPTGTTTQSPKPNWWVMYSQPVTNLVRVSYQTAAGKTSGGKVTAYVTDLGEMVIPANKYALTIRSFN